MSNFKALYLEKKSPFQSSAFPQPSNLWLDNIHLWSGLPLESVGSKWASMNVILPQEKADYTLQVSASQGEKQSSKYNKL